jgi:hypothetical protein
MNIIIRLSLRDGPSKIETGGRSSVLREDSFYEA